ncbi:MAG: hypothetical protein LBL74_04555 [Bacteroidales bacterium]|jgi:hypothetical protein|nr:hypothetical protein [Bacteroidales bacterium]
MKKYTLAFFAILFIGYNLFAQYNREVFTHPLNLKPISIYHTPYAYYMELKSDNEGGWIAKVKHKSENYFEIDIEELNLYNVWVHLGDLGLIVQNNDSIAIPVYSNQDTNSTINEYIYESYIGLIYDISDNFVFLQLIIDDKCLFGWVENKYLCSNPYTTCN